ncbi:hypothetical protein [uncultured Cellulomonas sp.]|uniref:hypothetical protein n=1 Tax=uncultured Cellulomonas sp. TaxID=189682 RepID=UPI0028EAA3D7|nr:hypothetical protein [uncultured Cellulomonas sp.]
MSTFTTIKVPKDLRDRIAALAAHEGTTLAGALTHALDRADEQAFWQQVHEAHAHLTSEQRSAHGDVGVATLRENLADRSDDQISAAGDW